MWSAFHTDNLLSRQDSGECWGGFIGRRHTFRYVNAQKSSPVPQEFCMARLGV